MREACAAVGIGCVTGCELRASFRRGRFADRKINSPDSPGITYLTVQGVPAHGAAALEEFRVLREEIRRNWSYDNTVECAIEFATLGDKAVAYGAAGMFLERFFPFLISWTARSTRSRQRSAPFTSRHDPRSYGAWRRGPGKLRPASLPLSCRS